MFQYWTYKSINYPALVALDRKVFCGPASSAPLERNFSQSGKVIRLHRGKLFSEILSGEFKMQFKYAKVKSSIQNLLAYLWLKCEYSQRYVISMQCEVVTAPWSRLI